MTWSEWRRHFEASALRPLPETDASGDAIPSPVREAVAFSLERFHAGEAGEGRVAREIWDVDLDGVDDDYRLALGLFVREEGRHARILAGLLTSLGGSVLSRTWTERLFVAGRRLMGIRLKLLVLLVAEVVGIGFYGMLASALPPGALRAALSELCGDETHHLRFHGDFFRRQTAGALRRALFTLLWTAVGTAAVSAVLLDHRRTLRALGVPLGAAARRLAALLVAAHSSSVHGPVTARSGSRLLARSGCAAAAWSSPRRPGAGPR